ncbi:MAG: GGDEF domain-containing protein [Alphaproteobacteria bacterium]
MSRREYARPNGPGHPGATEREFGVHTLNPIAQCRALPSSAPPDYAGEPCRADQSPAEQIRLTAREIKRRKATLRFTAVDAGVLAKLLPVATAEIDDIVARFYEHQVSVPEIARVIGDGETLRRLRGTMRSYILDLFSGRYDLEYVNTRLHIGAVHRRIGVRPDLYLASMCQLRLLLGDMIERHAPANLAVPDLLPRRLDALDKLMFFDSALIFDAYVGSLVGELKSSHRRLETLSRTDSLTGLLNRRVFDETLRREIKIAGRTGTPVSLAYIDLDRFKKLNDEEGHAEGDRVLVLVGDVLRRSLREGDAAFRLGGDEFGIVMPRTRAKEAEIACRRIGIEFRKRCGSRGQSSIGIAEVWPDGTVAPEDLLRRADAAMYEAKRGKGNMVRIVLALPDPDTSGQPPGQAASA